jgi:hypothetical protein
MVLKSGRDAIGVHGSKRAKSSELIEVRSTRKRGGLAVLLGSKPHTARQATAREILRELGVSPAHKRMADAAIKRLASAGKIKLG